MEFFVCLFFLLLSFCLFSSKKDFFSTLVLLEFLVILVFLTSMLVLQSSYFGSYLVIIFLCFSVCEAVVGLSLMVGASNSVAFFMGDSFVVLKI
nr:NADH dehydrogenase subunit 4L [Xylophagaidae sp. E23]UPX88984.1 NADH dehydrogenase subunit 4L [Xylophagaidae sp. E81]